MPLVNVDDEAVALERAGQVRRVMNLALTTQTAQQRDRDMQIHLAAARGGALNALLLRRSMDFYLRIRAARRRESAVDG
jgi:hypothetical protein